MTNDLKTPVISGEPLKRIKGRFAPGTSGNPRGKPKGAGLLRQELTKHAPEIINQVLDAARGGDLQACKLVLERILPPLRAEAMPIKLPELAPVQDFSGRGRQIVDAIADGQINIQQGSELLNTIMSLTKLVEADDLESRIKALEARVGGLNESQTTY